MEPGQAPTANAPAMRPMAASAFGDEPISRTRESVLSMRQQDTPVKVDEDAAGVLVITG